MWIRVVFQLDFVRAATAFPCRFPPVFSPPIHISAYLFLHTYMHSCPSQTRRSRTKSLEKGAPKACMHPREHVQADTPPAHRLTRSLRVAFHVMGIAGRDPFVRLHGERAGERRVCASGAGRNRQASSRHATVVDII